MRRGFTLIELLVVIAIIAILAAILFPVFAKAREKARSASCESNLKQISLAVLMYAQDYDEKFPRDWFVQCVTGPRPNWKDVIEPYIKNFQIFACPSTDFGAETCRVEHGRGLGVIVAGYGCNCGRENGTYDGSCDGNVALRGPISSPWLPSTKLADVQDSSGTIMIFESVCTMSCGYSWGQGANMQWPHNDGMNVSFTDGHVKWQHQGPKIKGDDGSGPWFHLMERRNWTNAAD
jgi:prepilin-type N-terminal cleavage/methylation domain-containing protein/prepilin-type processing-associated H-X9-DG protein